MVRSNEKERREGGSKGLPRTKWVSRCCSRDGIAWDETEEEKRGRGNLLLEDGQGTFSLSR